jgi:hypothetical protein
MCNPSSSLGITVSTESFEVTYEVEGEKAEINHRN